MTARRGSANPFNSPRIAIRNLSNTRLIDAKNAAAERTNGLIGHMLEGLIILLLMAELTALIYEIQMFYDFAVPAPL